jgi:hypothetical protein
MTNITNITTFVAAPNYGKESKWTKMKRRLNSIIVGKIEKTPLKFRWYKSYWHLKLSGNKTVVKVADIKQVQYLSQKPNYGAGIGHQLANWNAGLYFADLFNLKFAHYSFSTAKWENFLGFGEGEANAAELEKNKAYKKVRLPRFDSTDKNEIALIRDIINSYEQKNILFKLEADQGYMRQFDTFKILSNKFFNARARSNDKLIFSKDSFNIAIHIRRRMKIETTEVWKERGLDNVFFSNVLTQVLQIIKPGKKINIDLFSQGTQDEFPEFASFDNMHYCMDMGPVDSVLHMIEADLLISSKSSFSYKPALISKGIKICPATFWHGYPDRPDFITADNNGNFDHQKLKQAALNS